MSRDVPAFSAVKSFVAINITLPPCRAASMSLIAPEQHDTWSQHHTVYTKAMVHIAATTRLFPVLGTAMGILCTQSSNAEHMSHLIVTEIRNTFDFRMRWRLLWCLSKMAQQVTTVIMPAYTVCDLTIRTFYLLPAYAHMKVL